MKFKSASPDLEPTPPHLIYLVLSSFLILFALFSELIRNRFHLAEPPLALFVGACSGAFARDALGPIEWRFNDKVTQEITRLVVGLQVFTAGLELPAAYMKRHWKSVAFLLGPVMMSSWFISAGLLYGILQIQFSTALIIAATLTPTDPVLSASILGETTFSSRVPSRLKRLLSAESGCNDGSAFPFLYAALFAVTKPPAGNAIKSWFLELVLWQCLLGIVVGALIGYVANKALRFSESRGYVQQSTLLVFYFLLAMFSIGVASTLGLDDFLVAFTAGTVFSWDGWFATRTRRMRLPSIIDLILNSTMFVYFGTVIPWSKYHGNISIGRMIACVFAILLFRRLPALIVTKPFIPAIRTFTEALFAGHFGPMGIGSLFLAIEARAVLETGTSEPEPRPPTGSPHEEAIQTVWPVVCFIVLGSIVVHGFSPLAMSCIGHFIPASKEQTPLLGAAAERLQGMASDEESEDNSSPDDEDENQGR